MYYICKMKDRIYKIMQKAGMSNMEFAEKIGISTSSLSHIYNGRNKPSLEVVMRIHKAYPTIGLDWLLYGDGEMEVAAPSVAGVELKAAENAKFASEDQGDSENHKENYVPSPEFSSKNVEKEDIRHIDKPLPKITEIRIFFDNGTFEVFKPDK